MLFSQMCDWWYYCLLKSYYGGVDGWPIYYLIDGDYIRMNDYLVFK
jgi:hypothetical protein